MENNRDALLKAVEGIKNRAAAKGTIATDEEIAQKLGISATQLNTYLNGVEETPGGLAFRLGSAYNLKTIMIRHTETKYVDAPLPPPGEKEPVNKKAAVKSLKSIISFLKISGESKGMTITDDEMAQKTGITPGQWQDYLNGDGRIPHDLSSRLLSAYTDLLNSILVENNRVSLQRSIVWIRNRGLARGMNITTGEMAQNIGMTREQMYAYLHGEHDTMDDLSFRLESAYSDLLKDVTEVEIIEDIHMITGKED